MAILAAIRKGSVKWLLGFAFWTAIGLSFASQFYISGSKAGLNVSWIQAVSFSLGDWYVFALLSIPVMYLARRFQFESGMRARSLVVHGVCSIVFSFTYMVLRAVVGQWQAGSTFADAFRPLLVKTWHFNLLIYWVIVAVSHAFTYYRKYQERELRASELEKRLAQAKLQALQMQLNPHFLFNTLNSISALLYKDVEAAERMIVRLADLLRAALEGSNTQEVPLRSELEFLNKYLEIEKIRFGDRLTVTVDVAPEIIDAQVPNLILQPLVENAIRHGIQPRARPGRVELRAARVNERLSLEVRDNGSGLPTNGAIKEGVGISNTRARLRELYGPNHTFALSPSPSGGLLVQLTIPLRLGSSPDEN